MSTTTNFKRIALVAVAALGLGVLSSVPTQAVINADDLTVSAATASQTTAETFTATSATTTVSFLGATNDSVTVTASLVSGPSAALPALRLVETSSALVDSNTVAGGTKLNVAKAANSASVVYSTSSGSAVSSAKYAVYLSQANDLTTAPTTAGTYVVKLTPAAVGVGPLVNATAKTITITVTTAAAQDRNISAANSTLVMVAGAVADAKLHAADSTVVAVKTAGTQVANIAVTQLNAAKAAASESLTVTVTGPGTVGSGSSITAASLGKSITVKKDDYITVWSDGNAGEGTITITGATSGVLVGTEKVVFTATTPTSYATPTFAATDSSVILANGTTKVSVFAKDGTFNVPGLTTAGTGSSTTIWAYSSDTNVATVGTVAAFDATTGYSVTVTGVAVGTASISFGNASTRAAATIVSPAVTVRVGTDVPSNVTVTTDKATYAPGEKITMTVTILNAAGTPVVGKTSYANIFSAAGVTASMNLASGTLPSSTISDYSNTTNTKTFTLYAPVTGGKLTFSWTGGTALATANQVAKTLDVTVSDSGSAALAAVTALATTVASLRTLIVTLTNLVLKIQKKVKA